MKKLIRKCFLPIIILSILMPYTGLTVNAAQVPDTLRIGLYYSDTAAYTNTALSSFKINANSGLLVGFSKDNIFSEIYNEPTSALLTIRKDSYFTFSNTILKEVTAAEAATALTEKYGPYHIKIGIDYTDLPSLTLTLNLLKQSGIQAYPAYCDSWQIWVGNYLDEMTAMQDITNTLLPILGNGIYNLVSPNPNRIVATDAFNKTLCIFGSDVASFQVKPRIENYPSVFSINNKKYRGSLEVKRLTTSDMTVINVVTMMEYLYGNVPPEIGGNSPPEALKAQALASKMYAINNLGKHKKTGFDLCTTTSDQVYNGYSSEVASCNIAIDEIRDRVINYNGKTANAVFYFASGGGTTENVENVWGYPYAYLKSVVDKYEPIFNWTKKLSASDVKAKIPNIGNIIGMDITKTAATGRVTQLSVRGDAKTDPTLYTLEKCRTIFSLSSQLYTITTDADAALLVDNSSILKTQLGGKKVISATGVNTITSTNNKVTIVGADNQTNTIQLMPENYTFTGKGWGHAVGMSQEGAIGMAKAGFKYNQIIEYYFTGVKVE